MKIAYIHILPLEYYPPATNALTLLANQDGWQVRAWSSANRRGQPVWASKEVSVTRLPHTQPDAIWPLRIASLATWHGRTALEVALWRPDIVISVEPHSALATWLYYEVFAGNARLFIHHHEYYAPEDFGRPGMRVLRATYKLERRDLFRRAEWISQTNEQRLTLLKQAYPLVDDSKARVWPNYPTRFWAQRARDHKCERDSAGTRFLYLGSASLEDTFIGEFARWIAGHPNETSLHVVSNNISRDVWADLQSLGASNIVLNNAGWDYDQIPALASQFDVGVVLYKGNTKNFVYNVPNKTIEYLAAGLNVWYPTQMTSMREFETSHPDLPLLQMNFEALPQRLPSLRPLNRSGAFPFTSENAIAPLISAIEHRNKSVPG